MFRFPAHPSTHEAAEVAAGDMTGEEILGAVVSMATISLGIAASKTTATVLTIACLVGAVIMVAANVVIRDAFDAKGWIVSAVVFAAFFGSGYWAGRR